MRGTLYILTKEMIMITYAVKGRELVELTRRFAEHRGVTQEKCEETSKSVLNLLSGGRRPHLR